MLRIANSNLRHPKRLACGLIPLLNLLRERHIDTEAALRDAGIRRFELLDPAFTISIEQELKIVGRLLQTANTPGCSLALAQRYHLHNFSVLGLAIKSCHSLGEIFELIMRYPRLVWGICEVASEVRGDTIHFTLRAGDSHAERFLLERDMACIKTIFSEAMASDLQLLEVRFSHPAEADIALYENYFGCPVHFGQAVSSMAFPLAELDRPVPTADALSRDFYEAQCARLSASLDEPFRYSWLVRDQLLRATPLPDLETLATRLDIDARTLQRLLKKEEETFSHILRDVRLKRATDRLLYSRLPTERIAEELGFNDAVAFSHAFKQWTGLSPRAWLQQYRDDSDEASGSA